MFIFIDLLVNCSCSVASFPTCWFSMYVSGSGEHYVVFILSSCRVARIEATPGMCTESPRMQQILRWASRLRTTSIESEVLLSICTYHTRERHYQYGSKLIWQPVMVTPGKSLGDHWHLGVGWDEESCVATCLPCAGSILERFKFKTNTVGGHNDLCTDVGTWPSRQWPLALFQLVPPRKVRWQSSPWYVGGIMLQIW